MRWRPRVSTILVLVTLLIGLLPLGGLFVARIYESALVRQTESELIAQGVLVAASYRARFEQLARAKKTAPPADYGNPVTSPPRPTEPDNPWRPVYAALDLATDEVLPAPEDAGDAAAPADPLAIAVGADLVPVLRDAQKITLAGFRVTDAQGTIVATTGEELGKSVLHHDEVRRALAGEYVSTMRWRGSAQPPSPPVDSISRGTRIRVFVAVPIVWHERVIGSVLLARTPANIWQALYGKRGALTTGGIALLALLLGIALLTSLTIARPVRALAEQARRAARGEPMAVARLPHPGTREIAELSEDVAAMAQALESRANYIRDFAAQVSHEFKTPLTAMQGAVEMLREHGATMSMDERERFLGIVERDTKRLSALVRRLLELARADMSPLDGKTADVAALLREAADRARENGLDVQLTLPGQPLMAAMSGDTVDAALSGLLDNVRQHAGSARVHITVTSHPRASGDPEMIDITVADEGPGISAANAPKVFEAFFTTARDRGGTGLGLPIARALLRAQGGDLTLLSSGHGAAFRLTLPAAA